MLGTSGYRHGFESMTADASARSVCLTSGVPGTRFVCRMGGQGTAEAAWWEWLEQRPVGTFGAIAVVVGWAVLAVVYAAGLWTVEVTFFIAVAWLTFVLGLLSAFAATVHAIHIRYGRDAPSLFLLPKSLAKIEDYFRWLTPVVFIVGIIVAHYFWH